MSILTIPVPMYSSKYGLPAYQRTKHLKTHHKEPRNSLPCVSKPNYSSPEHFSPAYFAPCHRESYECSARNWCSMDGFTIFSLASNSRWSFK
eukprot:967367-Amorphochlora_amoeboformis.AAC.1